MKECIHLDDDFLVSDDIQNRDHAFCWELESPILKGACPCVHYSTTDAKLPSIPSPCVLLPCPYNDDGICIDPEIHQGNSDAMCFANKSRSIARLALKIYSETGE